MDEAAHFRLHRLQSSETARLAALITVFGEAFEDRETYGRAPPSEDYLTRLLDKDHFIAIVCLSGEELVGGLTAYVLDKPEQQRSEAYIYDLAVAKPHRRRGIATGLVRTLQGIAAERGAYVIFVQADLADAPAIALYDKLGAREEVLHFDIVVPTIGVPGTAGADC